MTAPGGVRAEVGEPDAAHEERRLRRARLHDVDVRRDAREIGDVLRAERLDRRRVELRDRRRNLGLDRADAAAAHVDHLDAGRSRFARLALGRLGFGRLGGRCRPSSACRLPWLVRSLREQSAFGALAIRGAARLIHRDGEQHREHRRERDRRDPEPTAPTRRRESHRNGAPRRSLARLADRSEHRSPMRGSDVNPIGFLIGPLRILLPRGPALVQALPMRPLLRPRSPRAAICTGCAGARRWRSAWALGRSGDAVDRLRGHCDGLGAARRDRSAGCPRSRSFFDALGQKLEGAVTTGPVLGPPLTDGRVSAADRRTNRDLGRSGALVPHRRAPNHREDPARRRGQRHLGGSARGRLARADDAEPARRLAAPAPVRARRRSRRVLVRAQRRRRGRAGRVRAASGDRRRRQARTRKRRLEELSILGQGSRTRIQVRRLVWSAGAGIAFSFDVLGRRIRIKPSFEYLHQEMDLIGVVHRAVKLADRPYVSVVDLRDFRQISLTREEKESYDGIGPGLELEIDAARLGPFVSSVYVMGRGYHLFGDLETTFSQTNEFGETATWTFEPDRWVWRAAWASASAGCPSATKEARGFRLRSRFAIRSRATSVARGARPRRCGARLRAAAVRSRAADLHRRPLVASRARPRVRGRRPVARRGSAAVRARPARPRLRRGSPTSRSRA